MRLPSIDTAHRTRTAASQEAPPRPYRELTDRLAVRRYRRTGGHADRYSFDSTHEGTS